MSNTFKGYIEGIYEVIIFYENYSIDNKCYWMEKFS